MKHQGAKRGIRPAKGTRVPPPWRLKKQDWFDLFKRLKVQVSEDEISLVAGGVAFFATLAIFPMLVALISLYGLIFSPPEISEQMQTLTMILPREASSVLETQLQTYLEDPIEGLGWGALFGLAGSLFSASGGSATLLEALNITYDKEERGFFRQRLLALILAVGGILLIIVSLTLIAVLPLIVQLIGSRTLEQLWALSGRWLALSFMFFSGLVILYRVAPSGTKPHWSAISWGATLATMIWLLASLGLSFYVEHISNLGRTYGSLGGVYALMLWLYVTAFVVLLGAELNAELEDKFESKT